MSIKDPAIFSRGKNTISGSSIRGKRVFVGVTTIGASIENSEKILKRRTKILQQKQPGLLGFLFESEAAFFIIMANVAAFGFIHYTPRGQELFSSLLLYPGNLLKGNYLCLVTSGFIHRNWTHLMFNMLGVFIFGRIVERRFGPAKTLFIYLGALVLSMFFSTLFYVFIWHRNVAIIGASGAVMGLMSCAMLLNPFCITYEMILPIPVIVKAWMFVFADFKGFLGGEKDGISHLAHLFGFVSVAVLVYFLSREDKRLMRRGLIINILSFVVFLVARAYFLSF